MLKEILTHFKSWLIDFASFCLRPNQSLKLTEPAVSFSPRAKNF